jgi:hypothetical protein
VLGLRNAVVAAPIIGLVQKVIPIARSCFRVLVDRDDPEFDLRIIGIGKVGGFDLRRSNRPTCLRSGTEHPDQQRHRGRRFSAGHSYFPAA